eukprot:9471649-Pyramimonas_sp.AAC.1
MKSVCHLYPDLKSKQTRTSHKLYNVLSSCPGFWSAKRYPKVMSAAPCSPRSTATNVRPSQHSPDSAPALQQVEGQHPYAPVGNN